MIPIIHFKGYAKVDPLDLLKNGQRNVSILITAILLAVGTSFLFGQTDYFVFEKITAHIVLVACLFAFMALSGFVLRKNASHFTFGNILLLAFVLYLFFYRNGIAWSYEKTGFVPPLVLAVISALICGPIALWAMRLTARLFPGKAENQEPSDAQYKSLFRPEWSEEATPAKPKGGFPFLLKALAVFYFIYMVLVMIGGVGRGVWEGPLYDWVEMNYQNPVLTSITFVKYILMFLLASLAAYNKGLRYWCGWLMAGGHMVSVAGSLALYFVTDAEQGKNFLLLSAIADTLVATVAAWAAIKFKEEGMAYRTPKGFPDLYSVPHRLMRILLLVLAATYAAIFVLIVLARLAFPEMGGIMAVFHSPDPLVVNAMTRYATLAAVFFMAARHEGLREALAVVIQVSLGVSIVSNIALALVAEEHAGLLLGSTIIDFVIYVAYSRIRAMFYRVEYGISYFGAASSQSILAFHEVLFDAGKEDSSAVLKTLDTYAGGIKGRKRGLLNFPFLLLEHVVPFLFLKPGFSTMDKENRRWFMHRKLLRSPMERKEAKVPLVAGICNALGVIAHGLISMSHFDQLKFKAATGFVPPDARDRLQGDVATSRPPFKNISPLPGSPGDQLNFKPKTVSLKGEQTANIPAVRIGTPVGEPDLPSEADYVILGSGAGGAIMAYRLATTHGINPENILLLDRGQRYSPIQDFNDREMEMYMKLYKEGGLQTTKRFDLTIIQGECVGGSTVVNNAICLKMPAHVRKQWEEDFGLDLGQLEAEYEKVKGELGIQTIPKMALNHKVETLFKNGVESYNKQTTDTQLEYRLLDSNHHEPNGDGLDNLGNKRLQKRSMLETYIPWAEAHGVKVIGGITGVSFQSDGRRATSVLVRTNAGAMKSIKINKALVVSCGAIASSHFLMRSKASQNAGRSLSCNFALPFNFHFPEELKAYDGLQIGLAALDPKNRAVFETYFNPPAIFSLSLPFFYDRQQKAMKEYNHLLSMGALIGSEPNGIVQSKADWINGRAVDWELGKKDVENLRYGFENLVNLAMHCGADRAYLPLLPGVELPLDEQNFDAFRKTLSDFPLSKKTVRLNTAHPQGGNRMCGEDSPHKASRALDADGKVVGYDNVFVADASVFPTSITVNPQWTIWALSSLAARKVAEV